MQLSEVILPTFGVALYDSFQSSTEKTSSLLKKGESYF